MLDKIAMQLYTLRDLCKTPADIASTFKALKEIGYPAVQVSGIGPIEPTELKKIADDFGLIICASHTAYEKLTQELDQVIETHKIWNCSQIAVPVAPVELRSGEGYVKFANEMNEVGEKLAKEGITLSYHNHAFEFEKFNGKTGLELIYETADPRYFQGEIDTYWIQYGGGDPVAWCKKLAGRLPLLHLKDYGIVDNQPVYMEIGEGNLDMPAILRAAREAGTLWLPVEQDVCRRPPLESAKISFENLKQIAQTLG
jgi:sugar phosphate isomerase/epimerase